MTDSWTNLMDKLDRHGGALHLQVKMPPEKLISSNDVFNTVEQLTFPVSGMAGLISGLKGVLSGIVRPENFEVPSHLCYGYDSFEEEKRKEVVTDLEILPCYI
ncbi:hypothetical protein LOAG_08881 [Loa loa]|uniref:Uncharacterized protein n=1 Tax=Loa loa TaxID=7209 RepID=A0A1S0TSR6_LOALO|nr:hypothetical protein LOAG_08881 [Loa loa]EFO19610.1 hypothetical protein LOAG_08881 [Loa loa]